ncbi:MAG: acetyltransferase [Clostridia bacterium]|nr:acetyltransferase [Clostridia bacterium]
MNNLIIIGASGHGKVVADIAQKLDRYASIAFLDDADIKTCMNYEVIGRVAEYPNYLLDSDFFVAIGNNAIRKKIMEKLLQYGATVSTLVHPNSVIGPNVEIGVGTVVTAGVVINPCVKIGDGVIVNTGSSIDHDCHIENYAHIAVGARVAGTVKIGENAWIGAGATVKNNVTICSDCLIGAGAVVVKDIDEKGTYVGVPARKLEK